MEQNLIISLEENTELKLTLLAIMRENDTWLIGDELGEKLNVPTKRVHTLISSLLQDLMDFGSDQIQLTILKGRGSYLQIDDPKEYVRFRQHLIESSVTFQIILAIATNDGPTLGQLSVNHFVSESLIRKRIHNVNQMIKKNEVKIVSRKNHYQFQGEEAQIRFILNTILWHLYRGSEWTFDTIDQKKLFQILQEICKTVNLPIKSLTLYEMAIHLLSILLGRVKDMQSASNQSGKHISSCVKRSIAKRIFIRSFQTGTDYLEKKQSFFIRNTF